jgi:hypothetical protein
MKGSPYHCQVENYFNRGFAQALQNLLLAIIVRLRNVAHAMPTRLFSFSQRRKIKGSLAAISTEREPRFRPGKWKLSSRLHQGSWRFEAVLTAPIRNNGTSAGSIPRESLTTDNCPLTTDHYS